MSKSQEHCVEWNEGPIAEDPHPAAWIPPEGFGDPNLEGPASQRLVLRPPVVSDAAEIWRMVQDGGELDANSPYAYLLLCSDFADCGWVVCDGGPSDVDGEASPEGPSTRMIGFVLGYRPPARPDTVFVWQIGVHPDYRGQGMGRRLLDRVVDRAMEEFDVAFLEATVTPSNTASRMLFTRFAVDRSAQIRESLAFSSSDFPPAEAKGDSHEDEIRLRIGPLTRRSR